MSYDAETLAYYEKAAPHYTASSAEDGHRLLDPFLDLLEPGACILELGCGTGRDAAHTVALGFSVDATDGSKAMARKANERHGIGARVMRFDELEAESSYDAVWAHASLHHLPRADLPPALDAVHRALRPGGLHFANYKLSDPEHPEEGRDISGRWASRPSPEWLDSVYAKAGFAIAETHLYRAGSSDGTRRDWLGLFARKQS